MAAIETEIKFHVDNAVALESQLAAIGFHLDTPRSFESNTLYDTPARDLRSRRELVRIRNYNGVWLLTHKRVPDTESGSNLDSGRHKHRIETETILSDGQALAEVFASIRMIPVFRYEKWRTEWSDEQGHCVIDETPLGTFAELEGPDDWIDQITQQLGISPESQLTISYGRLFEDWKKQTGSAAENLTFDEVPNPNR